MAENKLKRIDYFNFLFLFVLIIFYYRKIIFSPEKLIIGSSFCDLADYFYPSRVFGFGLLKKLILPLWCPYLKCGFPFIGTLQSAIFYPLNLVFLVLPINWAFNFCYIIHLFLSGIFTYLFIKHITKNSTAGLISAIIYMLCAFQILHIFSGNINLIYAMAWTPLVFLLLDKAIEEKNYLYAVIIGIIFGIQILAGYIQYVFHLGIFIFIYWTIKSIYQILKHKKSSVDIWYYIFILLILFTIACGISAVQLLPTLELSANSFRGEMSYEFCGSYSLPPENLITFILPEVSGNDISVPYFGRYHFWETCTYIGIPALIFILLAVIYKKGFYKNTFFFLTMISIILALGRFTPLFKFLYYYVPGFNLFRGNSKFIAFTSFFSSALAGLGVSVFITEFERLKNRRIFIIILFTFLFAIFITLITIMLFPYRIFLYRLLLKFLLSIYNLGEKHQQYNLISRTLHENLFSKAFILIYTNIIHMLSITGLFIGILILRLKNKIRKTSFIVFIIIIIIGDLWLFGQKYTVGFDPKICHWDKETKEFLKAETSQPFRMDYKGFGTWNKSFADGIELIGGYEHGTPKRFGELINLNEGLDLKHPQIFTRVDRLSPITELLGVKYYILPKEAIVNHPDLQLVFQGPLINIYENIKALPRVFIVHKATVLKNNSKIFDRLTDPEFDPRKEVILEELPDIILQNNHLEEEAEITSYEPNKILISAFLNENGILVLSDNYFPGWEVYVDGKKKKIFVADYTLRAVTLKKGRHSIEFIYRPKAFKYGLIITLITLAILILFFSIRIKRR